jgi:hypothetical protein
MRTLLVLAAFAVLSSVQSRASANETGFELGGRVGYGVPFGKIADESAPLFDDRRFDAATGEDDYDMRYWFASQIVPVQLDVGYRVSQRVFVGGYFSYGTVQVGDVCDSDEFESIACDSRDVRAGAEVTYHFSPPSEDSGWVGGGVGYEWLTARQRVSLGEQKSWESHTFHGLEANVQAGYDFSATDSVRIGPYALVGVGRFTGVSSEFEYDVESGRNSVPIDDEAQHGWVMFGLKASFGPF